MSKGKNPSPIGCKSCVKVWIDRCGLTGHKIQWHVNAEHHCREFSLDKRKTVEQPGLGVRGTDCRTLTLEGRPAAVSGTT